MFRGRKGVHADDSREITPTADSRSLNNSPEPCPPCRDGVTSEQKMNGRVAGIGPGHPFFQHKNEDR